MKNPAGPHDLREFAAFNPSRLLTNSRSGSKSQSAKHYIQSFTRLRFRFREESGAMSRYLPVLLIVVILLGGNSVSAQVTTATIAGVVQDSSGAVIPGVLLTVKNLDMGITRTVTTDEGGRYTVPDLTLGDYEVEAQLAGFQTEVRSGITLTVGRSAVVNFALQVGQLSDKVTITGEAPLVESTTATLSSLVDERTIRDLPLNGRSYDRLALLQPGTVIMGTQSGPAFD